MTPQEWEGLAALLGFLISALVLVELDAYLERRRDWRRRHQAHPVAPNALVAYLDALVAYLDQEFRR